MICPNKNTSLYKELAAHLGEDAADFAFRLNGNQLPNYRYFANFKIYRQSHGETKAFRILFNEQVEEFKKKLKAKEKGKKALAPLTVAEFNKLYPNFNGKFLPSEYSPSNVARDLRRIGPQYGIAPTVNGGHYVTKNGRGIDPTSPVFKLGEKQAKDSSKMMEAEKKWIKSKLGDDFPVDISHRLIMGEAWGMFKDQAISLYENAGEGTGYHETFHAVFRMALNSKEREAIMLEAKARKGWGNKSEAKIEEDLADEFAEYIITGGRIEIPQAQEGFFKKLLDFIKGLFNIDVDIESLYEGIDQGRFYNMHLDYATRNKIAPESGVAFKRIPMEFPRVDNDGDLVLASLTESETLAVMEAIDAAFFKNAFKNGNPAALFEKASADYSVIRDELINSDILYEAILNAEDLGAEGRVVNDLNSVIENVFGVVYDDEAENYVADPSKDKMWQTTMKAHAKRLLDYGIKLRGKSFEIDESYNSAAEFNTIDADGEVDPETNDSATYQAAIEFDTKDGIPPAAKALLLGITEESLDGEGNIYSSPENLNPLYFNKVMDPGKLYYMLAKALVGNTGDFTAMVDTLREYTIKHPETAVAIRQVVNRLDINNPTTTVSAHRLRNAFTQAFSKTHVEFALSLLKEDGSTALINPNSDTLVGKLISEWDAKFKQVAPKTDDGIPYISKSSIDAALNSIKKKGKFKVGGVKSFLRGIGVSIDNATLSEVIDGESVLNRVVSMLETFEGRSIIDPFNTQEIKGTLNAIAEGESKHTVDVLDYSHINPEGKRVFGITLNNQLSFVADKLNKIAGKGYEAMAKQMPYLSSNYSKNSFMLNAVLDEGVYLKIGLLEGTKSETTRSGSVTKDLGLTDKFAQLIDATLKGKYSLLRAADRGLENYIALSDGRLLINSPADGVQIFKQYLADEIDAMKVEGVNLEYFEERNKSFRFFSDIMQNVIKEKDLKYILNQKGNPLEAITDLGLDSVIDKAIEDHFIKQKEETIAFLKDEAGLDGKMGFDKETLAQYKSFDDMIHNYVYNVTAGYIEQTKLFIGDPIFFKTTTDLFKRVSMFNSTKKASRTDAAYDEYMNNRPQRYEGEKIYDGTLKTITFNDVEKGSDSLNELSTYLKDKYKKELTEKELAALIKPYTEYEEGDAQAYATLEAYREIMDRAGDWTGKHEKLYKKIINGEELPKNALVYFHPLKTQYAGPMQDYAGEVSVPMAAKHSIFPIHPRLVPEGSDLAGLATYMKDNNIGIAQFKSANKFGTKLNSKGEINNFYNADGELSVYTDEIATQTIYFDFFGIQLDVLGEPKTKITPGSQSAKIIFANLYENGVANPKHEKKLAEYQDTLNKITEYNEKKAASELGVAKDEFDNFVVKDIEAFKKTLLKISSDKNVDDNVKDSLATLTERDLLEFLPNYDKIQAVLTSYINKKVIKAKHPGGSKIQVASTGINVNTSKEIPTRFYTGDIKPEKDTVFVFGSNPEGRHGAGAAKVAVNKFGATYGQGEGLQGNAYALPTKDLRVKENRGFKSISAEDITESIKKMYETAKANPNKTFKVAYRNTDEISLNGYTGLEMIEMFNAAGEIPSNVVFSEEWANTGKLKRKSTKLKFYRKENGGVKGIQVLLPHWMKEIADGVSPQDLDPLLNEMIAFRIPTQGPSSIDLIEVVGFLDKHQGDVIVVPSEHVAKTGSDFDVDKLNIHMPAYDVVEENGKKVPKYIDENYERDGKDFTIQKLHNKALRLKIEIAKTPEFFSNMITPLDSDFLRDIRNTISAGAKAESMTDVFSGITNMKKFRDFLAGKAGVGQTALHITHHNLAQAAGLYVADNKFLFFEHNKKEGVSQFGGSMDVNKNYYISDMLSYLMNGYVDIAKDPYIFDLNAGTQTANTIFFMLRLGADPEWVMHFISQPILKEYMSMTKIYESEIYKHNGKDKGADKVLLELLRKKKVSKGKDLFIEQVRDIGYAPVQGELNSVQKKNLENIKKKYGTQIPLATLKKNHRTEDLNTQLRVLDEFLMYQDQAKKLQESVKASAVDTKGMGKNLQAGYDLQKSLKTIEADRYLENNDAIFEDTFLKGFKDTVEKYHEAFVSKTFIRGGVKDFTEEIFDTLQYNVKGAKAKEILKRDIESQYIAYLYNVGLESDTKLSRQKIEDFLKPESVSEMMRNLKHPQSPIKNNLFIQELIGFYGKGQKNTSGITTYNKKFDTYTKNMLIDSFRELFGVKYKGQDLGELLTHMAIVQSGTRNTYTSFGDLVPYEYFKHYLYQNVSKGIRAQDQDGFKDMFYRTNIKYLKTLPKKDSGQGVKTTFDINDSRAKQPYLVKWEKKAKGDGYLPILYTKVHESEKEVVFAESGQGVEGDAPYRFDFRHRDVAGRMKPITFDPSNPQSIEEAINLNKNC